MSRSSSQSSEGDLPIPKTVRSFSNRRDDDVFKISTLSLSRPLFFWVSFFLKKNVWAWILMIRARNVIDVKEIQAYLSIVRFFRDSERNDVVFFFKSLSLSLVR